MALSLCYHSTMKAEVKALRDLLAAVNLTDRIEGLKLYAAALVIAEHMTEEIEESGLAKAGYILEKLDLFTCYFRSAVMPTEGTAHDPQGWIDAASFNLLKVESEVAAIE